jgi:hypothetical protein
MRFSKYLYTRPELLCIPILQLYVLSLEDLSQYFLRPGLSWGPRTLPYDDLIDPSFACANPRGFRTPQFFANYPFVAATKTRKRRSSLQSPTENSACVKVIIVDPSLHSAPC